MVIAWVMVPDGRVIFPTGSNVSDARMGPVRPMRSYIIRLT